MRRYKANGRYDDGESPDGEYVLYKDVREMERELEFYKTMVEEYRRLIKLTAQKIADKYGVDS